MPIFAPWRKGSRRLATAPRKPKPPDAKQGATCQPSSVEATTKFLSITLKTPKALGITVPPSLLLRADEVIH